MPGACPARLPHRLLRHHCCCGLLVCVEKLLRDLERAKLAVPSEDFMVLGMIEAVSPGMEGDASTYRRELEMRWDGRGLEGGGRGVGAPARPSC